MIAIALAAFLTLALAAPAVAEIVMATPPITVAAGNSLQCKFVNLAPRPVDIGFEMWDVDGNLASHGDITVPAGGVRHLGLFITTSRNFYCRFAGSFTKSAARVSIENFDPSPGVSVLVVPGQ